jgi:hypothetical protein
VARLSFGAQKAKSQPAVASLKLKPAAAEKKVNGHRRAPMPKREFDYNRYFTDLLGAVSSHSSHLEGLPANGFGSDSSESNGSAASSENGNHAPAALQQASSDIISQQRSLIEEQKRLIQEQSKLIEEKTRLIAQKDQLLRLHAEMLDQKVL